MAISLAGLTTNLGSLLPSGQDIVQSVLVGAAANTVLAGLKAGGATALDPLGLFPKPAAPAPAPAATNNPAVTAGPTVTASAFAALPAASQGALLAAGVHIVAG